MLSTLLNIGKIFSKKTCMCGLLCLAGISIILAQNPIPEIKGKVLNSQNTPVESITVALYAVKKDSVLVKATLTNTNGLYSFSNMHSGDYYIVFSGVGFKTVSGAIFSLAGQQDMMLSNMILQEETGHLKEVVVTAKVPMFENKKGAMIMNVDASPSNAGNSALELLEKAPGVNIDNANNQFGISLKGKQGALIMIDGKPTYLSGNELMSLLKTMPASSIDKIELMSQPPSKYDANGNGGVINIKTKKGKLRGMNGNISASYLQGIYAKGNGNASFNYRNEKINIFGNYSYAYWRSLYDLDLSTNFRDSNKRIVSFSDQSNKYREKSNAHRGKLGIDYSINKNHIIGLIITESITDNPQKSVSSTGLGEEKSIPTSILKSNTQDDYRYGNVSGNLNYKGILSLAGTELNIDMDYAHYTQKGNQSLQTYPFDTNGNIIGSPLILKGNLPSSINIFSGKADFIHLFKNGVRLEAGVKNSVVKSDNSLEYYRAQGSLWMKDIRRSNYFIYEEKIKAAYVNISTQKNKWDAQIGIRVENTQSNGNQVATNTIFRRNYTNFFPNISTSYHINDKNDITFSFSSRMERPAYDGLNPFTYFSDSLNYMKGNPNLTPERTNNFEITYSYANKITATINYGHTYDAITVLFYQNTADKTTYQTFDNIGVLNTMGIAVNAPLTIKKWWETNLYTYLYNTHYKGVFGVDPLDISVTSLQFKINNIFNINKLLNAELGFDYKGRRTTGLMIKSPFYGLRGGVSRNVLNGQGSVKLAGQVYTYKPTGFLRYSDVDNYFTQIFDNNRVTLTFTYRFGKQTIAAARNRIGAAEEEKNRTKNGNE